MRPRLIMVDADGVTCDLLPGICGVLGISPLSWEPGEYNLGKAIGIPLDEVFANKAFHDADWWEALPKTPWADELIRACLSVTDVCFLTKPIDNDGAYTGRRRWFKKHYDGIPYLMGTTKAPCATGNALVDDCDQNVLIFNEHGGNGILFPARWNSLYAVSDPFGHVLPQVKDLSYEAPHRHLR